MHRTRTMTCDHTEQTRQISGQGDVSTTLQSNAVSRLPLNPPYLWRFSWLDDSPVWQLISPDSTCHPWGKEICSGAEEGVSAAAPLGFHPIRLRGVLRDQDTISVLGVIKRISLGPPNVMSQNEIWLPKKFFKGESLLASWQLLWPKGCRDSELPHSNF
jgi:hypothetical protein